MSCRARRGIGGRYLGAAVRLDVAIDCHGAAARLSSRLPSPRMSRGRSVSLVVFAACVVTLVACRSAQRAGSIGNPWRHSVEYIDPAGRFAIEFPSSPHTSSKLDRGDTMSVTIKTISAKIGGDWEFALAWSDAPAGVALARTQTIRPETPEENASRDHGSVMRFETVQMFGRDALEFSVRGRSRTGQYTDRQQVLGGRLYELTVTQRGVGSRAFDRFANSFRLLEPPIGSHVDFFAAAEKACRANLGSLPTLPDTASPAERGAGVMAVADGYAHLVAQLEVTSASARDQGDAAAFLDAVRRSIEPGREFARAVAASRPEVRALGRATHGDTDLETAIARRHGAPSCA